MFTGEPDGPRTPPSIAACRLFALIALACAPPLPVDRSVGSGPAPQATPDAGPGVTDGPVGPRPGPDARSRQDDDDRAPADAARSGTTPTPPPPGAGPDAARDTSVPSDALVEPASAPDPARDAGAAAPADARPRDTRPPDAAVVQPPRDMRPSSCGDDVSACVWSGYHSCEILAYDAHWKNVKIRWSESEGWLKDLGIIPSDPPELVRAFEACGQGVSCCQTVASR